MARSARGCSNIAGREPRAAFARQPLDRAQHRARRRAELGIVDHSAYALLPGTWFAFYAIGLFASRGVIPSSCNVVTVAFTLLAFVFLITPLERIALSWWVMPLGFGVGQLGNRLPAWRSPAS